MNKRFILLLLVLVSNAAIIAGAAVFDWNSLTVVAVFVADGVLGLIRISFEKAFARQPPADGYSHLTERPQLVLWNENLLEKYGSVQISDRFPSLTIRHLPYAIKELVWLVVVGGLITLWYRSASAATIAPTLVTVLPLFVARHALIIAVWADKDVYEHSAPDSVRHFSDLYLILLVALAVFLISPQQPDLVVLAAVLVLVPKLLFDLREAGIGPWPLTFDPTIDTSIEERSEPTETPRYVFQTDNQALLERGYIHIGIPYVLNPGLLPLVFIAAVIWPLIDFLVGSAWYAIHVTLLLALVFTVPLMLEVSHRIIRLGYGNVEYRIYDDKLVAYDRYLEEIQWVVPFDDIRSISTEQQTIRSARILPLTTSELTAVELECATSEDRRVEFLAQPDEFVRIVRESARGQAASI